MPPEVIFYELGAVFGKFPTEIEDMDPAAVMKYWEVHLIRQSETNKPKPGKK